MPELKNTFTGGRMEKDLDERVVPNGLYREALNIEVSTSEGSDVGAVQNILGNIQITEALQGPVCTLEECRFSDEIFPPKYQGNNRHIAHIVDPETDMLYRLIATESLENGVWMDRIVEYDTTKKLSDTWDVKEKAVMVDVWKVRTKCEEFYIECGVTNLKVRENFGQIRPNMVLLYGGEMRENCRIMTVTWGIDGNGAYANMKFNSDIIEQDWFNNDWCGSDIYFAMDRILNFHPDRKITGINILDGMLFWTDNYSEPKKVNIERGKLGSHYELNPVDHPTLLNYKYEDFDKHTKLVINVDELTGIGEIPQECIMLDRECPIPGCTDPTAINYDPLATMDDGSCIPCIYGCMDVTAFNYDSSATCDDGSCCYVAGCTNPINCNYNPSACYDNGSCSGLYGCMDQYAINFMCASSINPNSQAFCGDDVKCDDGSCVYKWKCGDWGYTVDGCDDTEELVASIDMSVTYTNPQDIFPHIIQGLISNSSYSSGSLLSTGCYSGICSGIWFILEEHWSSYDNSGTGNGSATGGLYFAEQLEPSGSGMYKCIKPSTGNPATMNLSWTSTDKWLVSRRIKGLTGSNLLPEDALCVSTHTCNGPQVDIPGLFHEDFESGSSIVFLNGNQWLGTGTHGIGFTQNNSNWSWSRNIDGYPDILTMLQWNGFDGSNPWDASLVADITLPYNGGIYLAGTTMPSIDETWAVEDVFAIIGTSTTSFPVAAVWRIYAGVYNRTWTQWDYSMGVPGATNSNVWELDSTREFGFELDIVFDWCLCDGWESCVCEKDPLGTYNTKIECEIAGNSSTNCCWSTGR